MTLLHFLQSFGLSRTLLPYLDVPVICTQDKLHTFWVFKIMFRNYDQFKTRSTLSIHTELGKIVCLNINRKCRTTIYVTQIIWHLQREIQMIKHNRKSLWQIVRKKIFFRPLNYSTALCQLSRDTILLIAVPFLSLTAYIYYFMHAWR